MPNIEYFRNFLVGIGGLVNTAIPILIGVAVIIFFWGLIQYIRKPEEPKGKQVMIAGLVGLFIMVSVWGIVRLGQNVLGIDSGQSNIRSPSIPSQVPSQGAPNVKKN